MGSGLSIGECLSDVVVVLLQYQVIERGAHVFRLGGREGGREAKTAIEGCHNCTKSCT